MWSPEQYEKFKEERRQPFDDLLSLIERRPEMRVADLGCGTGELTRELHETLAARETVGVDSSPAMLERARRLAGVTLRFERADAARFAGGAFDLIFSNAALHWVSGHAELFARLRQSLRDGGQLAIQMPANDRHPSHVVAARVAATFGIAPRPSPLLTPAQYAALLHRLGFARQHVRLQVYGHLLPSSEDVVQWVRGALLTHYEEQLDARSWELFLEAYRRELLDELGQQTPYFYTYDRILLHAVLP